MHKGTRRDTKMKNEKISEFKEEYKGVYSKAMEAGDFEAALNTMDALVRFEVEHDPNDECNKKLTVDEFKDEVLRLADEFYFEHSKWPNELHVGSLWLDAFDKIADRHEIKLFSRKDPQETTKHWWYMGMRCFREHWTHSVEWREETEKIKKDLDRVGKETL